MSRAFPRGAEARVSLSNATAAALRTGSGKSSTNKNNLLGRHGGVKSMPGIEEAFCLSYYVATLVESRSAVAGRGLFFFSSFNDRLDNLVLAEF